MQEEYLEFLKAKMCLAKKSGMEIDDDEINPLLKPHQRDIVRWAIAGGQRAVFASFGLGKTVMQLEICRLILKHKGGRGLIICPLGVRGEFMRDAKMLDIKLRFVKADDEIAGDDLYITNYESIREGKINPTGFIVVSLDEAAICFPPGTLVESAEKGLVPIESLQIGDKILNCSGVDAISETHKSIVNRAVKITLASKEIISSDEHKYFTRRGWISAAELQSGDFVMETAASMRLVRTRHHAEDSARSEETILRRLLLSEMANVSTGNERSQFQSSDKANGRSEDEASDCKRLAKTTPAKGVRVVQSRVHAEASGAEEAKVLLSDMFRKLADEQSSPRQTSQGAISDRRSEEEAWQEYQRLSQIWLGKRDEAITACRDVAHEMYASVIQKNGGDASSDRPSTPLDRRERQGLDRSAKTIAGSVGRRLGSGVRGRSESAAIGLADMLLSRPGESGDEAQYRGGRLKPHGEEDTKERCQEDSVSDFVRVDRVEILERGNPELERFADSDGNIYFHDVTATRHPSYSVEGSLVHNCRGFGGTKTFRELMKHFEGTSIYRFVATATPDPNEYIELLAYSAFLGIMDVGQGKTVFFKRDSTKADKLTIHPHRAAEFWLWVSSWAIFLQRPSDIGHSDEGYSLPPMNVEWHEVPSTYNAVPPTRDGQGRMFPDPVMGLSEAAHEKRESMDLRIAKMLEIAEAYLGKKKKDRKDKQIIVWCDLNDEQDAIEKAFEDRGISCTSLRGSSGINEREVMMDQWRNKETCVFLSKLSLYGSGANLQQCCKMIYAGIGFKFADFIQGAHRVWRFLQVNEVFIHLLYTESETSVRKILEGKWEAHTKQLGIMSEIIREHGLASINTTETMKRTIGCDRKEVSGEQFRVVNNDTIIECDDRKTMPDNSVKLIITSIPFSFQYEYSPSYNDLGHTESNTHFWAQMDFLAPNLLRVLAPGRVMAIHVKDRIVPGGLTGFGFQTLHPFHAEAIYHYQKHGFAFLGMKTVVTDVVRENNQTYRLGWTEQCKDGSRMGCGVPEYVLLFRKPPTDRSVGYADEPVVKVKPQTEKMVNGVPTGEVIDYDYDGGRIVPNSGYSRSRWQLDAHGFARSGGNRLLSSEELTNLPHEKIFKKWREESLNVIHDSEHHVANCEVMERDKRLPSTFMIMPPASWHPDVWTDIARMRTLNMEQERKGNVMHLCPLQFDIVNRLITQFSMEGEVVFDPFGGLLTVPYCAIKLRRFGMAVELNAGYFKDGSRYCKMAEANQSVPSLFDLVKEEDELALIDG